MGSSSDVAPLIRLSGVARHFGERELFADLDLVVRPGDRVGIVGPNGSGKTTLVRIAAGLEAPDAGEVARARAARIGLLRQELDPGGSHSPREAVAAVFADLDAQEAELRALERRMAALGEDGSEVPPDLAERYDRLHHAFQASGGFEREAAVDRVLEGLGFDADARGRPLHSFSGGWLMRVELAKLLVAPPDLLLLDEPTNHLDLPSLEWFEDFLLGWSGAVAVISHERRFLRRHARRIAAFESGRLRVYDCGFDAYLVQREERRELLKRQQRAQQREIAHTERFVERFRYKASKARQVQSRVKALERMERVQLEDESVRGMKLRMPDPVRAGRVVLALDGVHKAYGDTPVYTGADFTLERGERVALVGPNGAGKSTLLRLLAGTITPDAGERTPGHNVTVAFYAQHQLEALTPGRTLLEELESVATHDDIPRLRGHLGAFLFSGDDVHKRVEVLSGGEKARLALAKMLLRPANCLVMDEPTNHLDLTGREVLERALAAYRGTLVCVSHDRDFVDAIATRVVEVRAGRLRSFPGNYSEYLERCRAPAATDPAAAPQRADRGSDAGRPQGAARQQDRKALRRHRTRLARRVRDLEAEVEAKEAELADLDARLADPALHKDGEAMREGSERRSRTAKAIEALYRDWEAAAEELAALSED